LNQRNRHAAFSYRRRDALHRAEPDIAAGENAGYAGFKEIGIATLRPPAGLHNIITGKDIPPCIAGDLRGQQQAQYHLVADVQPELRRGGLAGDDPGLPAADEACEAKRRAEARGSSGDEVTQAPRGQCA